MGIDAMDLTVDKDSFFQTAISLLIVRNNRMLRIHVLWIDYILEINLTKHQKLRMVLVTFTQKSYLIKIDVEETK